LAAATGTHRPEDDGGGRAGEARLPLALRRGVPLRGARPGVVDGGGRAHGVGGGEGGAGVGGGRAARAPGCHAGLLRGDGGRRRGLRARVRRREPRRVGRAPRRRQLQDALREEELGTVAAPL
jgi:hypothetical protein